MESARRNHRADPDTIVPKDKDQRNLTDSDLKIMKTSNKDLHQRATAQIVTTEDQIMVAADVNNQASDIR